MTGEDTTVGRCGTIAIRLCRRRGSSLLLVLVLGGLVTMLTLVAMRSLSASLQATATAHDEVQVEEAARSGIDITIAALSRLSDNDAPQGSAGFDVDGTRVDVAFVSGAGRADINHADHFLLAVLLRGVGADETVAQDLAQGIIAWRRGNGSGKTEPQEALADVEEAHVFRSVYELLQLPGMTSALFSQLKPLVTTCSGTATIDPGQADIPMLRLLLGDNDKASAFHAAWRNGRTIALSEIVTLFPADVQPYLRIEKGAPRAVEIDINAQSGKVARHFHATLCANDADGLGYVISEWQQ